MPATRPLHRAATVRERHANTMHGSILQLNTSKGGIPKRTIAMARVTELGLEGDGHDHPLIHGGPRQALLFITSEGIAELAAAGFPVSPGTLGENITTLGLDRRALRIGQRWRIGADVVIEFTKIRVPCDTLNPLGRGIQAALYDARVKAGDAATERWGLSGFYAKVISPGEIRTGDEIARD